MKSTIFHFAKLLDLWVNFIIIFFSFVNTLSVLLFNVPHHSYDDITLHKIMQHVHAFLNVS
jgi:hypothetical protein